MTLFSDSPTELLPHGGSAELHPEVWSPDTADDLFDRLRREIDWEQHRLTMFGRRVDEPRLSHWYGDPDTSYVYSGTQRRPSPWFEALITVRNTCEAVAEARFNSVLANLYRDGSDSMGWHSDDEPELGTNPVIASVSLGATRRFRLKHRESGETVGADLTHGSVLVMRGRCQHEWTHSVPKTTRDVGERINLTFRWTVSS